MAGKGVSVVIEVEDRSASKKIEGFNKRLEKLRAPQERFVKAVGKTADLTGLTDAARGVASLTRSVVAGVASLGRFAPALAGLTSVASVAGLAGLTQKWSEFGTRLGLDARRIGVTSERLHGLQGAARLAGASADDLTSGMKALGDNLFDAAGGRNAEVAVLLGQLGVSFRDSATGGARLADEVLPEVADKIAALKTPALQARVATQLFGGAGEALLPFLRKGAAGLAEYRREAERYGVTNQAGVDGANELRMAQTRLGLAVEGVGYSVSQALAPVLVPLLGQLSDWVAAHRAEIAEFFKGVATDIGSWIQGGGIQQTIKDLEGFGTKVNDVVQYFGGWTRAAELLGIALVAKVCLPLGQAGIMIARLALGTPLGRAVTAGVVADQALRAIDPNDKAGAWMDRNVPGAAWFDDFMARNTGLGRTYAQQAEVEHRFNGMNSGGGPRGITPGEAARGGRPQLGASAPTPGSAEQQSRARQAVEYFEGQGWSHAQASGLAARMKLESGFNAGAVGDGQTAYGANQWHGERRAKILAGTGINVIGASFEDQLRATQWELTHSEKAAGDMLRATRTSREAGEVVSRRYIRPGLTDDVKAWEANRTGALAEQYDIGLRGRAPQASAPPIQGPPAPLPPQPLGGAGANGTLTVITDHRNTPPGVTQQVSTTGDVVTGNVRQSRPGIGLTMP